MILGPARQSFAFSLEISHTFSRIGHLGSEDVLTGLGWETKHYGSLRKKNSPMTFNFLDRGHPALWRNSFIPAPLWVPDVNVLRLIRRTEDEMHETSPLLPEVNLHLLKMKSRRLSISWNSSWLTHHETFYISFHTNPFLKVEYVIFKVKYLQRKLDWPKSAFNV